MKSQIAKLSFASITLFLLLAMGKVPVYGENEFALRIAPVFGVPVGSEIWKPGMGAAASLDWAFLRFSPSGIPGALGLGVTAGAGFGSMGVADGSTLSLLEGGAGAFLRWRPFDRWTFRFDFRTGVYQYQWEDKSNTRPLFSGGLSADFHLLPAMSLFAEAGMSSYAFTDKPITSLNFGLGVRLNLTEIMGGHARVRSEKTDQRRIFPVSYAWYEHNPVAAIHVANDEPNTITDINFLFFMDRYMGQPVIFATLPSLGPGEAAEIPVTALFNEAMLSLTENVSANGLIQIQYRSLGTKKEAGFPVQMPVYHRNAMNWDDDRRAAAFVSARDPAARLFAKYTASVVDSQGRSGIPRNVQYAAALFEALTAYGISYVIDPASSFVEMSDNASALDSLNYPYQTLLYRGGDCDDLSILFCAMLEVLGVDTAFITIPGHIYMAFDTGEGDWNAAGKDLIEHEGRRWMPVEITVPGEGFAQAWRIGAREWRNAEAGRKAVYPMGDSWKLYPPVSVPGAGDRLPLLPPETEIVTRYNAVMNRLKDWGF